MATWGRDDNSNSNRAVAGVLGRGDCIVGQGTPEMGRNRDRGIAMRCGDIYGNTIWDSTIHSTSCSLGPWIVSHGDGPYSSSGSGQQQ